MLNLKAILMALAGVVVVGGIGTYVVLENTKDREAVKEVSAPAASISSQDAEPKISESSDEVKPADANADETEPKANEVQSAKETSPTADWVVPAFDLLRVEPDGSTVIAGRGQPNTKLKIMNGDEVIAEADVGPTGDFVVIFEEALNSGDYQLSLKVEDEAGVSLTSEETAIVSIPENSDGQLLAMVQKPGEASRIITPPEIAQGAAILATNPPKDEGAAAELGAIESTDDATVKPVATPTTDAAEVKVDQQKIEPEAETVAKAENGAEAVTQDSDTQVALNSSGDPEPGKSEAQVASDEEPLDLVKGSDVVAKNDDLATISKQAVDETKTEVASIVDEVEQKTKDAIEVTKDTAIVAGNAVTDAAEKTEEMASAIVTQAEEKAAELLKEADKEAEINNVAKIETASKTDDISSSEQPETQANAKASDANVEKLEAPNANVRIEAVEVEGDKLFVAGVATAGYQVRVFADGEEVGVASVTKNGRFLVEATKDLDVGQHQITAALEERASRKVLLRAIVPFNRPKGEALAAVAASPEIVVKTELSTEADMATTEKKPEEAKTEIALKSVDDVEKTENTEMKKAVSDEVFVETNTKTETDKKTDDIVENSSVAANDVVENSTVAVVKSDGNEVMVADENKQATPTDTKVVEVEKLVAGNTQQVDKQPVETIQQSSEPKTIVQDELQPASRQSVIIRRGDTLWQIARRTYGAGVRYTTIYLANQQQIDDPDMISPGQIFAIPDEALDNAEEIHRNRLDAG